MHQQHNDYRRSHTDASKPKEYDPQFWTPGTTSHLFWEIEQMLLTEIICAATPRPERALDFACGTGRVLSFLEKQIPETVGVDISAEMLSMAKQRCRHSRILQGDLTTNPYLLRKKFDLVTAFRFFLNAQPELRQSAVETIARLLKPKGLLVANFHLNPHSLTGSYLRFRHWLRGTRRAMVSPKDAEKMLRNGGFEIVGIRGYGYLFHRRQNVRLLFLRGSLEKMLARMNPWPQVAMNFLIVARPN